MERQEIKQRAQVDPGRVITVFQTYMEAEGHRVTRAQFERDIAAKAVDRAFLGDVQPMLAPGVVYDPLVALNMVQDEFVARLPGAPWRGR